MRTQDISLSLSLSLVATAADRAERENVEAALSRYQLPCPLGFLYWSPIDDRARVVNALFINIDFTCERIIPIARAIAPREERPANGQELKGGENKHHLGACNREREREVER